MSYRELLMAADPLVSMAGTEESEEVVSVFGVPFDSTSSFRSGSRFAPNVIRTYFMNVEVYSPGLGVDVETLKISDLGNMSHTADPKLMVRRVEKLVGELLAEGRRPAILGGEHTLTLGSLRAIPKKVGIVIFDAHYDLREEFDDLKLSHATFLRRFVEEEGADRIIHVGARAASSAEWDYARNTLTAIPSETIATSSRPGRFLRETLEEYDQVYVSVDLDVFDPSVAPGVANPEHFGPSGLQILSLIHSLKGKSIVGFDIVELSPPYDTGTTASLAAKVLAELISVASSKGVKRRR